MTEILLEGLEFYAHHGVYQEEQELGNRFQVDLRLTAKTDEAAKSDDLSKTIDYVKVYHIIEAQMDIKFRLLESLAEQINQNIAEKFPTVESIECTVSKFNPPLGGLCKRVCVSRLWTKGSK